MWAFALDCTHLLRDGRTAYRRENPMARSSPEGSLALPILPCVVRVLGVSADHLLLLFFGCRSRGVSFFVCLCRIDCGGCLQLALSMSVRQFLSSLFYFWVC